VPSRRRIATAVGITTHVYRPPFARSRVLVSGTQRGLFLSFLFGLSRRRPGSTFSRIGAVGTGAGGAGGA
jgi:hypothetical protein